MYDPYRGFQILHTASDCQGKSWNHQTCEKCQTIDANKISLDLCTVLKVVLHQWFGTLYKFSDLQNFQNNSMQYAKIIIGLYTITTAKCTHTPFSYCTFVKKNLTRLSAKNVVHIKISCRDRKKIYVYYCSNHLCFFGGGTSVVIFKTQWTYNPILHGISKLVVSAKPEMQIKAHRILLLV